MKTNRETAAAKRLAGREEAAATKEKKEESEMALVAAIRAPAGEASTKAVKLAEELAEAANAAVEPEWVRCEACKRLNHPGSIRRKEMGWSGPFMICHQTDWWTVGRI